jgi:hypothetical protein
MLALSLFWEQDDEELPKRNRVSTEVIIAEF